MNDALVRQILQCPTLPSLPKVAIDVARQTDTLEAVATTFI